MPLGEVNGRERTRWTSISLFDIPHYPCKLGGE